MSKAPRPVTEPCGVRYWGRRCKCKPGSRCYRWQHEPRDGKAVFSVVEKAATVGADEAKRAEGDPGNGGAAR